MKKFAFLCMFTALLALPLSACGGGPPSTDGAPRAEVSEEVPPETVFPPEEPLPPEEVLPGEGSPSGEERVPAQAEYLRVTVDGLNVRTGAGTEFPVLGTAERNTLLPRREKTGGWYKTFYRGRAAFVSADERFGEPVSLGRADGRTEKTIEEGCRLLGVPYVYGAVRFHDGTGRLLKGFSEDRFDCSSLMQYIFYRGAGVLLGTTTRAQVKQGTKLAWTDLKRGDLLFFTNASREHNTGIERVGHVALYLGGNYILHTASDYAKIEQISAKRRGYFLEGRRVW